MAGLSFPGGSALITVDAHAVRKSLLRVGPEIEAEFRKELKDLAKEAAQEVKMRAPVRTGRLKRNVTTKFQFNKSRSQASVTVKQPSAQYAWIVEHGRKNYRSFSGRGYIAEARAISIPRFEAGAEKAINKALRSTGLK